MKQNCECKDAVHGIWVRSLILGLINVRSCCVDDQQEHWHRSKHRSLNLNGPCYQKEQIIHPDEAVGQKVVNEYNLVNLAENPRNT